VYFIWLRAILILKVKQWVIFKLSVLKGHYDELQYNPVFSSVLDMLSMLPITYSKYSDHKIHMWCPVRTIEYRGMPSALYINRRLKIVLLFTTRHHLHLCTYMYVWAFRWARLTEISNQKHDKAVCQSVQLFLWDFCWKLLISFFFYFKKAMIYFHKDIWRSI